MTTFDLTDAGSLGIIALYLCAASLNMLLPLAATTKSWLTAWQLTAPISWSVQILFAYVCYSTKILPSYPWLFLIVVVGANCAAVASLVRHGQLRLSKQRPKLLVLTAWIIALAVLLFSRLYDAIAFVSPGNPDAFAHMTMLEQLVQTGRLANSYYAPGFHLLLLPLTKLVPLFAIIRFSGPIIGSISTLGIIMLLWERLKSLELRLFAVALFCLPIFNRFLLQTIGFFPSAMTFLVFTSLIYLIGNNGLTKRQRYTCATIITLMLAVTVPYLFVQYILAIGAVVCCASVLRSKPPKEFLGRTRALLVIALIGLVASAGHVYLQTHVIARQGGFPNIPTITYSEQGITTGSNYAATSFHFLDVAFGRYQLYQAFAKPMISTGRELLSVKYPLPLNQPITIASVAWISLSAGFVGFALRRRDYLLFVIATMSIVFGLATLTGLFEMSFYRGRSGWYFSLLILIGSIVLSSYLVQSRKQRQSLAVASIMLATSSLFYPLTFPRLAYPEIYAVAKQLSEQFSRHVVSLGTNETSVARVSPNLSVHPLTTPLEVPATAGPQFFILEKQPFPVTQVLSTIIFSPQKDLALSNPIAETQLQVSQQTLNEQILNDPDFAHYRLFWKNANIAVYQRAPVP